MYREIIENQIKKIEKQIEEIQVLLKTFPEGKLFCSKNGRYVKWYKCNGLDPIYIPKKQRELAEQLALKKYYTSQMTELLMEHKILKQALKCYEKNSNKSEKLLEDSSPYKELLASHFENLPEKLSRWINEEYNHNTNYEDSLIHTTLSGQNVRSKSEVMIADSLYMNKIPFRYECELCIGELVFYPDFTIMHPKTGKIIYWEHFGMIDQEAYSKNAFNKLNIYSTNGIIPSINLITTFETKTHPLTSEMIIKVIKDNFLL